MYRFCSSKDAATHFTEITGGTQITADQCRSGFNKLNFTMYGGNSQTPRTIPLYNYHNGFLASPLSLTDEPFFQTENPIHNYTSRRPPVYAPGELKFVDFCNFGINSELEDMRYLIIDR